LFAIPFIGLWVVIAPPGKPFKSVPSDARAALLDLSRLHERITQANHPLLSTLVDLEIVLLVAPAALIAGALRGRLLGQNTKMTVMAILESKEVFRWA